jgi:hypothetical protein
VVGFSIILTRMSEIDQRPYNFGNTVGLFADLTGNELLFSRISDVLEILSQAIDAGNWIPDLMSNPGSQTTD